MSSFFYSIISIIKSELLQQLFTNSYKQILISSPLLINLVGVNYLSHRFMELMNKLGQFIKYYRRKKGWTQTELSIKVFKAPNQQYISRLELGKLGGVKLKTLERILLALDADVNFTMGSVYFNVLNKNIEEPSEESLVQFA